MAVSITQTANPAGVGHIANVTTYAGLAIGTARDDRLIIAAVGKEVATVIATAVTIDSGGGAVAMTFLNGDIFGSMGAHLYYLNVPTGTTATVAVTWDGAITGVQNHIALYSVLESGPAPTSSGQDTSTDMDVSDPLTTGSTTIPVNGGMFALATGAQDAAAGNKTWANLTEDLDADAGNFQFTTAFSTTAGTAIRTCTGGTSLEDGVLAWAIFASLPIPALVMSPPQPSRR